MLKFLSRFLPISIRSHLVHFYEFLKKNKSFIKRRLVTPKIPVNPDGKVYLNLGCATTSGEEFINIDVLPHANIHHIQDITNLSNFDDDTVDMVYASHVVEHIPRDKFKSTLLEWRRVLKPGGTFRFAVPNFDALIDIYQRTNRNVEYIRDQVLGQDPPYNNHYTLWNFDHAKKLLIELGYDQIEIWSPDKVENHNFVDRSSRTLKVGDEQVLFSLNIQAKKVVNKI